MNQVQTSQAQQLINRLLKQQLDYLTSYAPQFKQFLAAKYFVFEGIDGSGKSSLSSWLYNHLLALLNDAQSKELEFMHIREPGSTSFGEKIRNILLHGAYDLNALTQLMLFMSSRNELVQKVISPALKANKFVLSDRSYISSYAYQVKPYNLDVSLFHSMVESIYQEIKIDLVTYNDIVDIRLGLKRANRLGDADDIESKGIDYYLKTQQGYNELMQSLIANSQPVTLSKKSFLTPEVKQELITKITQENLVEQNLFNQFYQRWNSELYCLYYNPQTKQYQLLINATVECLELIYVLFVDALISMLEHQSNLQAINENNIK